MKPPRSANDSKTWMSRAEVARLLEVAPVTVGRWASEGKLPYATTLGGRRRFHRDDVVEVARRVARVNAPIRRRDR
jgi:excisionase family DNA binding protein